MISFLVMSLSVAQYIYKVRFFSILYTRQHTCIPMGAWCSLLNADVCLFCYERDFMLSLSDNYQVTVL